MINEPPVDELLKKLGTEDDPASRYVLCVVVAKRARQIMDRDAGIEKKGGTDEIGEACEEIAAGRIKYVKD